MKEIIIGGLYWTPSSLFSFQRFTAKIKKIIRTKSRSELLPLEATLTRFTCFDID